MSASHQQQQLKHPEKKNSQQMRNEYLPHLEYNLEKFTKIILRTKD